MELIVDLTVDVLRVLTPLNYRWALSRERADFQHRIAKLDPLLLLLGKFRERYNCIPVYRKIVALCCLGHNWASSRAQYRLSAPEIAFPPRAKP